MSMTERDHAALRGGGPRRTRAQVNGAVVAILALLWALFLRDDPAMTVAHRAVGWVMIVGLALYLVVVWRGRA